MARQDLGIRGNRIGQTLAAAREMLAVCSSVENKTTRTRRPSPASTSNPANNSARKCRSVQFGLVPQDFHRLRQISEKLGWSRAELARRCLLLVMNFLEDQFPELSHVETAEMEDNLNVEQLSLWPPLVQSGDISASESNRPESA